MITVGEILKKARKEKKISLEEIERETKIKKEYLQALEEDHYQKLPAVPFIQGFIKNYGRFLDLEAAPLMAIFRRDFKIPQKGKLLPEKLINPPETSHFSWTPKITLILITAIIFIFVILYLFWQYQNLIKAPYFSP